MADEKMKIEKVLLIEYTANVKNNSFVLVVCNEDNVNPVKKRWQGESPSSE